MKRKKRRKIEVLTDPESMKESHKNTTRKPHPGKWMKRWDTL